MLTFFRIIGAFAWVVALMSVVATEALAQDYVGAQVCKSCHEYEYQVWAAGPHAAAEQHLTAEQLADPKCTPCHATQIPVQSELKLMGVECEACHGPGEYYHPDYVMKDKELAQAVGLIRPTATHCQQCHNQGSPSILPFDFEAMWARIQHGKKAKAAWKKKLSARIP